MERLHGLPLQCPITRSDAQAVSSRARAMPHCRPAAGSFGLSFDRARRTSISSVLVPGEGGHVPGEGGHMY
jgi:hypothetical protein